MDNENNPHRNLKDLSVAYTLESHKTLGFGYRHVYSFFPKFIKDPVLNLGCGSGALEVFLAKKGIKDITSVDYYNTLLESYDKVKFIKHNLEKFPYPFKERFNTVAILAVISILESPYNALKEINRLLNLNGILLVSFAKHKKHFNNTGIKYIHSSQCARFLLRENGFQILRQYNDCYLGLTFLQPLWNILPSHYTWFVCKKIREAN